MDFSLGRQLYGKQKLLIILPLKSESLKLWIRTNFVGVTGTWSGSTLSVFHAQSSLIISFQGRWDVFLQCLLLTVWPSCQIIEIVGHSFSQNIRNSNCFEPFKGSAPLIWRCPTRCSQNQQPGKSIVRIKVGYSAASQARRPRCLSIQQRWKPFGSIFDHH